MESQGGGGLAASAGLVLLPLALFAVLGGDVLADGGPSWDGSLLHDIHQYAPHPLGGSMRWFSMAGSGAVLVPSAIAAAIALTVAHRREDAFLLAVAGGFAAVNPALKLIFHRPRPAVVTLGDAAAGYSFPSGHAMSSALVIGAGLLVIHRRPWWLTTIGGAFVLAIGLSRLYLGAHYPSDVLGGWLLALSWIAVIRLLQARRAPAGRARFPHRYLADIHPGETAGPGP